MNPAAILFDLDGTLIDSRDFWFVVVSEASRHFGGREVTRPAFEATFGQSAAADAAEFFPAARVEDVDAFYDASFARHGGHVRVLPGATQVVAECRELGRRLACVTNASTGFAVEALNATGLAPLLDVLACADEVKAAKPAPDMVHLALLRLGVSAADAVLVGDSRYDVEAARAAGVRSIGVRVGGDARIESLAELEECLRRW